MGLKTSFMTTTMLFLIVVLGFANVVNVASQPMPRAFRTEHGKRDRWLADADHQGFDVDGLAGRSWSFDRAREWGHFAYADEDSAELVIGVSNSSLDAYVELRHIIDMNGGWVVNTVSTKEVILAVVADVPFDLIPSFVNEIKAAGLTKYIEPNMRFQTQFVPNDPDWPLQWGPRVIEADYAWNGTIGDPSVLVAVIDTGIDWDHPDLAANYVALGYDWVHDDANPMDDNGHGTHCAGIIAAVLDNSVGIAGLAQVMIMAEKGLDAFGSGWEDDLADAILHAVDEGADILSNSWGGYGESALIHDAVKYACDNSVLVIAAAGNDAIPLKLYPAAYEEVIAVTATDQFDNPTWFSNFGHWVELAAPGYWIYSTVWNDSHIYASGTSMSAPHVAGVAALIWSEHPHMTRDQIRVHLRHTADDLGDPGFDQLYGYGRVNARRAVEQDLPMYDLLIFDWKRYTLNQREGVYKEAVFIQLGDEVIVNTTILNMGATIATDIDCTMLVNDTIADAAFIPFMESGNLTTVNLSWSPSIEGMYNLTCHVVPGAPGLPENATQNNVVSTYVHVRDLTLHFPIVITGDSGFTPENGVIGGSGVPWDPYIIEGWNIETPVDSAGIFVSNSRVYFIIRNVHIRGSLNTRGIVFSNVSNGVVENSIIASNEPVPEYHPFYGLLGASNGRAIDFNEANECTVINNHVIGNFDAIFLYQCSHTSIICNKISENEQFGINVDKEDYGPGQDITLHGNNIIDNGVGIYLSSPFTTMDSNRIDNNTFSFNVDRYYDYPPMPPNGDVSNTINGKPIRCLADQSDIIIDSSLNASFLWTADSYNVTVQGLNLYGLILTRTNSSLIQNVQVERSLPYGMVLSNSHNNIISGNDVRINHYTRPPVYWGGAGIRLKDADNNALTANNLCSSFTGIAVSYSSGNNFTSNNVSNNRIGIRLFDAHNSIVTDNTVVNCYFGVTLVYADDIALASNNLKSNLQGLVLDSSSFNSITANSITENTAVRAGIYQCGIYLCARATWESSGNEIHGNHIADQSQCGILLESSCSSNIIYNNNFSNNTDQAEVTDLSPNSWDNGYPSGGNYWSDYVGVDLLSGPKQNQPGSDGIGDTPYIIAQNNRDRYPLMNPYIVGDVNRDGKVDVFDLINLGKAYGSDPSKPHWNPNCDLNNDGKVDASDLSDLNKNYGKTI